jgi:Zn-dependent metalloprotease
MSDIFTALIEKWKSQSNDPANNHVNDAVWKIKEDILMPNTPGDALRYMFDPQKASNYDYYPTQYVETSDYGGIHTNSGIANLGE